jgi:MEDS: MEthanogen/methylotroph, DcmR Sensory domain
VSLEGAIEAGACPHLAMLLQRPEDVWPTLASFYALGAKRNGWLFHRALARSADEDRRALSDAGLDVAGLEAAGRMVVTEVHLPISVDDYVRGWEPQLEAALARGFDAAWWARSPIGPDPAIIERSVDYDRAWDEHFAGRPCVSLCLFIVGDLNTPERTRIAANHDQVLTAGPG